MFPPAVVYSCIALASWLMVPSCESVIDNATVIVLQGLVSSQALEACRAVSQALCTGRDELTRSTWRSFTGLGFVFIAVPWIGILSFRRACGTLRPCHMSSYYIHRPTHHLIALHLGVRVQHSKSFQLVVVVLRPILSDHDRRGSVCALHHRRHITDERCMLSSLQ